MGILLINLPPSGPASESARCQWPLLETMDCSVSVKFAIIFVIARGLGGRDLKQGKGISKR